MSKPAGMGLEVIIEPLRLREPYYAEDPMGLWVLLSLRRRGWSLLYLLLLVGYVIAFLKLRKKYPKIYREASRAGRVGYFLENTLLYTVLGLLVGLLAAMAKAILEVLLLSAALWPPLSLAEYLLIARFGSKVRWLGWSRAQSLEPRDLKLFLAVGFYQTFAFYLAGYLAVPLVLE